MTGYAFPDMLVDVVKLSKSDQRDTAHDLFDAHLPLIRYEQQQGIGLAVRKYVLQKRSAIAYDSQRAPGSSLTAKGRSEVDYLLGRLAQRDPRAKIPPRT
jgi:4-hydroxy-tetrahydrodipicolinate synthase